MPPPRRATQYFSAGDRDLAGEEPALACGSAVSLEECGEGSGCGCEIAGAETLAGHEDEVDVGGR